MVNPLTLDSSIIVAALREDEEKHERCRDILQKTKSGEFAALEPYSVLVEVVSAIRRRTGSEDLAERVGNDLQRIDNIFFFDLIKQRADKACKIAKKTGIRGMDAMWFKSPRRIIPLS